MYGPALPREQTPEQIARAEANRLRAAENARRDEEARLAKMQARAAEFVAEFRTGMKIESDQDMATAKMYALVVGAALPQSLEILRKTRPLYGDWYVAEGEDPEWGIGLRLEIEYNRQFIGCSLRRATVDEPLRITLETLHLDAPTDQIMSITPAPDGYHIGYWHFLDDGAPPHFSPEQSLTAFEKVLKGLVKEHEDRSKDLTGTSALPPEVSATGTTGPQPPAA